MVPFFLVVFRHCSAVSSNFALPRFPQVLLRFAEYDVVSRVSTDRRPYQITSTSASLRLCVAPLFLEDTNASSR